MHAKKSENLQRPATVWKLHAYESLESPGYENWVRTKYSGFTVVSMFIDCPVHADKIELSLQSHDEKTMDFNDDWPDDMHWISDTSTTLAKKKRPLRLCMKSKHCLIAQYQHDQEIGTVHMLWRG